MLNQDIENFVEAMDTAVYNVDLSAMDAAWAAIEHTIIEM